MPLKKGSSQGVVKSNISELVSSYDASGAIGTSHPKSRKQAIRQSIAIAMKKAGKSRGR